MQSYFFFPSQPLKLSSADGQMLPSMQHCGPEQTVLVPGHLTVESTLQCPPDGVGEGPGLGPGPLQLSLTHLSHSAPSGM